MLEFLEILHLLFLLLTQLGSMLGHRLPLMISKLFSSLVPTVAVISVGL